MGLVQGASLLVVYMIIDLTVVNVGLMAWLGGWCPAFKRFLPPAFFRMKIVTLGTVGLSVCWCLCAWLLRTETKTCYADFTVYSFLLVFNYVVLSWPR
jgi:hypothetical protein